jgi:hypothetical protein
MEPDAIPRPPVAGYLVVLVGVAGWVVGCFLPLYRIAQLDAERLSLVRQVSFGSFGTRVGGILYLFGGISAIGVISILGLLRIRSWIGVLLAGAVIAWFLVSIGVLISIGSSFGEFNTDGSLGIGYWCCWASVIVVVAGTIMVSVSSSRTDVEADRASPPGDVA